MAHPAEQAIDGIISAFPGYGIDDYLVAKGLNQVRSLDLVDEKIARQRLGKISRMSLHRMMKRGDLIPVRVGTRIFFDPADLDAYVASRKGY